MRGAEQVERMRAKGNVLRILAGKPEGKRPLGRPRRRWILKWILRRLDEIVLTVLIWLRIGTSGGFF
jgi:hypothetical protein